jgi:hypothetical protein
MIGSSIERKIGVVIYCAILLVLCALVLVQDSQLEEQEAVFPQVCRVIMPEDLDR